MPNVSNADLVKRLEQYPMTLTHVDESNPDLVWLVGADLRVAARRIRELEQEVLRLRDKTGVKLRLVEND